MSGLRGKLGEWSERTQDVTTAKFLPNLQVHGRSASTWKAAWWLRVPKGQQPEWSNGKDAHSPSRWSTMPVSATDMRGEVWVQIPARVCFSARCSSKAAPNLERKTGNRHAASSPNSRTRTKIGPVKRTAGPQERQRCFLFVFKVELVFFDRQNTKKRKSQINLAFSNHFQGKKKLKGFLGKETDTRKRLTRKDKQKTALASSH